MKKLYLIDVSSLFFRAFYAVRPLTSPAGLPVNAIYGFLSMVIKLLKEEKPEYMVFCYDRKEPSFRKEMYSEYKAHRTEMPEDLAKQIPYIKKLADLLGIPSLEVPSYEADDLIGTLAKYGKRQGMDVVIVSGDKDFAQLIEAGVILYDTMKDVRYDSAGVFEKWGIRPDQFIDFLAIVGDASDNIPGVRGLGEKGTIKLLQQFTHLEDIYNRIDEVESKSVKEKLLTSKDNAFISKKLVTIVTDIELPEELNNYKLRPCHTEELRQLLTELNFKTFEKSLLGLTSGSTSSSSGETTITTASASAAMAGASEALPVVPSTYVVREEKKYEEQTLFAKDLAEQLQEGQDAWGFHDNRGVFVGTEKIVYNILDPEAFGVLADTKKIRWSGYDLKNFWHKIAARHPIAAWDSQLAAYVSKAGDCTDFSKTYTRFMAEGLPELASLSQLFSAHQNFSEVVKERLKAVHGEEVYKDLELPLIHVLLAMEDKGILIDTSLLGIQGAELGKELAQLEEKIHEAAGEKFNIASPKQLGVILFEKMSLPAGKKTKTGYSTDNDVLEGLDHPMAKLVLQWRELAKLKSTYVDALPQLIHSHDGRLHTSFNQALTTTGRLSSTQPNLQNIPIRTERGQRVRQAFIAAPGKKLLSVDYSQIELRILAHISQDPNLCKAFAEDLDIHAATAAEIYNVPLSSVTSELRRAAKAVNFGIAYGQGAFGLAENLGIGRGEAKEIIARYFERFKNVGDYIEQTIRKAHEDGYVETLFGRRRYIDELSSKNNMLKKFGERAAINAPIQGTASDLVKKAMIEVNQKISLPMLLQVHDELIFEDSEENLKAQAPALVKILEGVAELRVPLKVNYAVGNNWDEAH